MSQAEILQLRHAGVIGKPKGPAPT
jgi:hypothetical protein